MTKLAAPLAAAAALLLVGVSAADAGGSRSVSGTGPYGGTWFRSGSCAGGTCASSGRYTGPNGYTVRRSAATSCAGGTCTRTRSVTGPYGRSVTRTRTVTRR
jgi:hypothetical protein